MHRLAFAGKWCGAFTGSRYRVACWLRRSIRRRERRKHAAPWRSWGNTAAVQSSAPGGQCPGSSPQKGGVTFKMLQIQFLIFPSVVTLSVCIIFFPPLMKLSPRPAGLLISSKDRLTWCQTRCPSTLRSTTWQELCSRTSLLAPTMRKRTSNRSETVESESQAEIEPLAPFRKVVEDLRDCLDQTLGL